MCDICDTTEKLIEKQFKCKTNLERLQKLKIELKNDLEYLINSVSFSTINLIEQKINELDFRIVYLKRKIKYYESIIDYRNKKVKK